MASEVVYTKVSPKERVNFTSEGTDTGDQVTYAEVNVKWKSDTADTADSTPETTHSVTCWESSLWFYVIVTLCFCTVALLITVILLALKCYRR